MACVYLCRSIFLSGSKFYPYIKKEGYLLYILAKKEKNNEGEERKAKRLTFSVKLKKWENQ